VLRYLILGFEIQGVEMSQNMLRVLMVFLTTQLPMKRQVQGDPSPEPGPAEQSNTPEQELLTKYLLARLLDKGALAYPELQTSDRRDDQEPASSVVYPQRIRRPLQRLVDQAKENIDVIDFRNPHNKFSDNEHLRHARQDDQHHHQEEYYTSHNQYTAPSEAVPIILPFPGTEPSNRGGEGASAMHGGRRSRFSMPLALIGEKKYYIGMFFKANWYKSSQYCRFHGMHLASINSVEEQTNLEEHIQSIGMGEEHFWTSGTDQAEEGKFFWMSTGKPITYENWNAGEPNNFQYENGEKEHCLELWNRDGKGLRWNDTPCSFETFFVCEV